ncbi:MAG: phosphate ABC transporter substrate-binding protein PstS [Pseudomonadota bacterium]
MTASAWGPFFTPLIWMLTVCIAVGCKPNQEPGPATGESGEADGAGDSMDLKGVSLNGAGASFPFPIYSQWASKFNRMTGLKLNYQSIGSGGGIAQIKARTVDFGASDAPLEKEGLDESGLLQFPMVMGGVVPVVNLEGVREGELKLSAAVLADICLGKITRWSDAKIRESNEGVPVPDKDITVVHRADGSGTTWIFTSYLTKVSEEWKEKVGTGKAVSWPVGVGGKGNEGVAANVQRIAGSIGYVEYAYALQNNIPCVRLENRAGKYVKPTIETFQAAAANADWENAPGFYMVLTNQPGDESWPITGASFILLYKDQKDAAVAKPLLSFFDWCFKHGAGDAEKLHYVPMPEKVVSLVQKAWSNEIKTGGKPVWQP